MLLSVLCQRWAVHKDEQYNFNITGAHVKLTGDNICLSIKFTYTGLCCHRSHRWGNVQDPCPDLSPEEPVHKDRTEGMSFWSSVFTIITWLFRALKLSPIPGANIQEILQASTVWASESWDPCLDCCLPLVFPFRNYLSSLLSQPPCLFHSHLVFNN